MTRRGFTPEEAQRLAARVRAAGREVRDPGRPKRRKGRIRGVSPAEERTVDGILFHSKAEARRWSILQLARVACELRPPYVLRQVPFHLPGEVQWRADFVVFWADGRVTFEDVKGHRTDIYRTKRKMVEAMYGIRITEIPA